MTTFFRPPTGSYVGRSHMRSGGGCKLRRGGAKGCNQCDDVIKFTGARRRWGRRDEMLNGARRPAIHPGNKSSMLPWKPRGRSTRRRCSLHRAVDARRISTPSPPRIIIPPQTRSSPGTDKTHHNKNQRTTKPYFETKCHIPTTHSLV